MKKASGRATLRAALRPAAEGLRAALRVLWQELATHSRPDPVIALLALVYLALLLPTVDRATENPQQLAAFVNDEPFLTMALEATTEFPWGNPANYFTLDAIEEGRVPEHWGNLRYPLIFYYGGAYFQLGAPVYGALRLLGFEAFPAAPIVLRSISVLAGLWSLVLLYGFARRRYGMLVGALAATFLLTDSYFVHYASIIHPDALQLFFGLLAFLVAVRHSESGDRASLFALGLLAGVVQGTKLGGPWLVPAALLAVWWGLRCPAAAGGDGDIGRLRKFALRAVLLGAGSLLGWFVSTPYAFLDAGYYFGRIFAVWGMVSTGPFGEVDLLTWLSALRLHWGDAYVALAALGFGWGVLRALGRERDEAAGIAVVLSLSQLAWFGSTGGLWVQLGYMLVGFGLVAVLAGDVVDRALRHVSAFTSRARPVHAVAGLALVCMLIADRWYPPVLKVANLNLWRHSTVMAIDRWARGGGIEPGSAILYDDLAYFDTRHYPDARMLGGVMTWASLRYWDPDYLVLSSSLYDAPWYRELRATQRLGRDDPNPYSVRLYQDLLRTNEPGSTGIKGIELVRSIRPVLQPRDELLPANPNDVLRSSTAFRRTRQSAEISSWFNQQAHRFRQVVGLFEAGFSDDLSPVVGPELRVFRVDVPGWGVKSISSETLSGYAPGFAFDATARAWNSARAGRAAEGAFVGRDFGAESPVQVAAVRIQWVYRAATPSAIGIDFSDDGLRWTRAGDFTPEYPPDAPNWREEVYEMPSPSSHRFWRLVATRVPKDHGFGVAELTFLGPDGKSVDTFSLPTEEHKP